MINKPLLITVFLLMFLPAQFVSAESVSEKQIKKIFKEYQKALKKGDMQKVWNSYSINYQKKYDTNYDVFSKGDNKGRIELYGNLKIEDVDSSQDKITLVTKLGGIYSRFTKTKYYVEFILADGTWKINDLRKSVFFRTPRRGYRPEDFSGLDEKTKAEVAAIKQLCSTFSKSLGDQNFRTAWECLWNNRPPYDNYLTNSFIRGIKKRESLRKRWASRIVLDIKIENDIATVDLCKIKNLMINLFSC